MQGVENHGMTPTEQDIKLVRGEEKPKIMLGMEMELIQKEYVRNLEEQLLALITQIKGKWEYRNVLISLVQLNAITKTHLEELTSNAIIGNQLVGLAAIFKDKGLDKGLDNNKFE